MNFYDDQKYLRRNGAENSYFPLYTKKKRWDQDYKKAYYNS